MQVQDQDQDLLVNHHSRGPSVVYNAESHIQVLFQMHASVWTRVLPFCLLNCVFATLIYFYDLRRNLDFFSISDSGHVFMSLMVSYLTISRLHNSLNRYMDGRKYLSHLMSNSRELMQQTIAFTRYGKNRIRGMQWRVDVAKRLVSLLLCIGNNLLRASSGVNYWEQRGLTKLEIKVLLYAVGEANERAPNVLNIFLRSVIVSHVCKLDPPLEVVQEIQLLKLTSNIITAYENIMKDVNTPYPFPLVQMTRTFLIVYVFSLPLALLNDIGELAPLLFVIFFLTYGFLGLELVAIEMDDPYGDDDNDFNVEGLISVTFEDMLCFLYDIDGKDAVDKVKREVKEDSKGKKIRRNNTFPVTTAKSIPQAQPMAQDKTNIEINDHDDGKITKKKNCKKATKKLSRRGQFSRQRRESDLNIDLPPLRRESSSLEDPVIRGSMVLKASQLSSTGEIDVVTPSSAKFAKLVIAPSPYRNTAHSRGEGCAISDTAHSNNSFVISPSERSATIAYSDSKYTDSSPSKSNDIINGGPDDDLSLSGSESSDISYEKSAPSDFFITKHSNESNCTVHTKSSQTNESTNFTKSTSLSASSNLVNNTPMSRNKRSNNRVFKSKNGAKSGHSLYTAHDIDRQKLGVITTTESVPLITTEESTSEERPHQI